MAITEDYVNFETAKLLKKKGFSENTEHEIWYVIKQFSTGCPWNSCTYKVGDITREYNDDCCILMPTLQMAMKWLREVHDIYIDISIYVITKNILKYNIGVYYKKHKNDSMYLGIHLTKECSKYEKAVEVAIKYCLENLI